MSQSKKLKDISNSLVAIAEWLEKYRVWWETKYGKLSDQEFTALTNGSTPPPPPPRIPPE